MRKQKENFSLIPDNESMLVSERKLTNSQHQKPNNDEQACACSSKLSSLENKLEMLGLRLEEVASSLNISFTKHTELYTKMIEEEKKRENIEYVIWEMKQMNKASAEKLNKDAAKQNQTVNHLSEEVQSWARLLRELKNWKNSQTNWASSLEKEVYESMKKYRGEADDKLKKMYEVVSQIGLLQRKMIEKPEQFLPTRPRPRTSSVKDPRPSLPVKSSGLGAESTFLGASYQTYV